MSIERSQLQYVVQSIVDDITNGSTEAVSEYNAATFSYFIEWTLTSLQSSAWPYLLLALWMICSSILIGSCLYCKWKQTNYTWTIKAQLTNNANNMEPHQPQALATFTNHDNNCRCLWCLQKRLAQEMQRQLNAV